MQSTQLESILNLVVEDGYVHAKGTTLGGDDGIAVAMGLAILEDNTIEHPELEVVLRFAMAVRWTVSK